MATEAAAQMNDDEMLKSLGLPPMKAAVAPTVRRAAEGPLDRLPRLSVGSGVVLVHHSCSIPAGANTYAAVSGPLFSRSEVTCRADGETCVDERARAVFEIIAMKGGIAVCWDVALHRSATILADWPACRWMEAQAILASRNLPTGPREVAKLLFGITDFDPGQATAMVRLMEAVVARYGAEPHDFPGVWAAHDSINFRGVAVDVALVKRCSTFLQQLRDSIMRIGVAAAEGELSLNDFQRPDVIQGFLTNRGLQLPDLQAETLELACESTRDESAQAVMVARLAAGMHGSGGKFDKLLASVCGDDRLRGGYAYAMHRLGRWTSPGVGLHGLKNSLVKGVELQAVMAAVLANDLAGVLALMSPIKAFQAISGLIRLAFVPADGCQFIVADFSRMEPRVLLWLAGDDEALASVQSIYPDFATSIFKRLAEPGTPEYEMQLQVGKVGVLGCGFGVGGDSFANFAHSMGVDLAACKIDPKRVVQTYRNQFPRVPMLWRRFQEAAVRAIEGGCAEAGKVTWEYGRGDLVALLPSGRRLVYPRAEVALGRMGEKEIAYGYGSERQRAWGGVLTQNITSAVARDIFALALVRAEDEKLPVVMHTHDELVVEVPKGDLVSLERVKKCLETPERWWGSLAMVTKPFATGRYGKEPYWDS